MIDEIEVINEKKVIYDVKKSLLPNNPSSNNQNTGGSGKSKLFFIYLKKDATERSGIVTDRI